MSPDLKPEKPARCPTCGKGELQPRTVTQRFEYEGGGEHVTVVAENLPVRVCDVCGETLSGPVAARLQTGAIGRALGLLPAEELRAFRERLGKSPEEFARLTGIRLDDLSEWERGRALQPRALDCYLRLLLARPDNLQLLEALQAKIVAAARPLNGAPGERAPAAVKAE